MFDACRRVARTTLAAGLLTYSAFPAMSLAASKPEFGPNVLIFNSSMPSSAIQHRIDEVYTTQQHNEFGEQRTALMFLPGDYKVDIPVGFYTEVIGLELLPMECTLWATCTPMPAYRTTTRPPLSGER